MLVRRRFLAGLTVTVVLAGSVRGPHAAQQSRSKNSFANPSFEMGRDGWYVCKCGQTAVKFSVDSDEAAAGEHSVRVSMGSVDGWGAQFGQKVEAGQKGKTYTFAVLAKSTGKPVEVGLEIERTGKPYDRAARAAKSTLTKGKWTELHATFKVEKDFPQGWFAYISCTQPSSEYRADMFRLYEGDYVPYQEVLREAATLHGVRVFDTRVSSPAEYPSRAFSNVVSWIQVPENKTAHAFTGDAVVLNDRLAVVARRNARGAEVYAKGPTGMKKRAVLRPATQGRHVASVKLVQNNPAAAAIDATFGTDRGQNVGLRFGLQMGQTFVKTEPLGSVERLRIEAPCRFAVMPDFFADDMMIDAHKLPVTDAELPGDSFLLHLLGNEEAILMAVRQSRADDMRIALSGRDAERVIGASEIPYGKDRCIWVAVMEGEGIWHARDIARNERGKALRLDWQAPFPAQWRVAWSTEDGLTDSWEMIVQRPDGRFTKHGWFGSASTLPPDRKRWTSVLNRFRYPCWIDKTGQGYLQPLAKVLTFQGPAIIYPINREKRTPLDRYSVVDIVRQTLGVGPCEYILDVEAQQTVRRGRATCATRDKLDAIYKGKQQRGKKAEIEKALDEVLVFVKYIRGRIQEYVDWGHEMQRYLHQQKEAAPELAELVAEMKKLTQAIDLCVEKRKAKIKTPAYVAGLCDRFRRTLIDYEGADALDKCKAITSAIVVVGGNQDALVGECRVAAKRLRQRAGLAMAFDPGVAEIAREIRQRTHRIMRNPASYESPRY